MNRYRTLILVILLSIVLACAAVAADNTSFFFVQLADVQLGYTNKDADMIPEIDHLKKAVEQINRLKPAFVLISGDMVDKPHDPKQIRTFWNLIRDIRPDVPLYLVPGNHDIGFNPVRAENVRSYEKIMGKDHYSFSYNGSEFIVLNSPLISDTSDKTLRDEQLKWFEAELAAAQARHATHIFVCDHHPWFLTSVDEPNKYQNVPLPYRSTYLDLMNRYGVEYALSGHLHYELIAHDRKLTLLTDGPLSKSVGKPPIVGFRIVKVYKDRVEHQFYALDNIPEHVNM